MEGGGILNDDDDDDDDDGAVSVDWAEALSADIVLNKVSIIKRSTVTEVNFSIVVRVDRYCRVIVRNMTLKMEYDDNGDDDDD